MKPMKPTKRSTNQSQPRPVGHPNPQVTEQAKKLAVALLQQKKKNA